jgi:hypothetical protein
VKQEFFLILEPAVNAFKFQRSGIHVKSDPLIREFCDLPRQYHGAAGGKTREKANMADETEA